MTLGSTILLILISVAIGFLIGALVYGLRARPSEPASGDETQTRQNAGGVHIRRDSRTQNLAVEMDGRTYQKAGELSPEVRSRMARLAREWLLWLGLAATPTPFGTGTQNGLQASPVPPSGIELGPAGPPALTSRPEQKGKAEAAPQSNAQAKSIAAQIDAILQARLEHTPLANRGVQLVELPDQGMVVTVDGAKYTDLTQVPDEQVRSAIAEAVAEWEQSNAPPAAQTR